MHVQHFSKYDCQIYKTFRAILAKMCTKLFFFMKIISVRVFRIEIRQFLGKMLGMRSFQNLQNMFFFYF